MVDAVGDMTLMTSVVGCISEFVMKSISLSGVIVSFVGDNGSTCWSLWIMA